MHQMNSTKMLRGCLGYSGHALVEFVFSRNIGLAKSKVETPKFKRINFQMFKGLMDEIPWDTILRDRGNDQTWQVSKNN